MCVCTYVLFCIRIMCICAHAHTNVCVVPGVWALQNIPIEITTINFVVIEYACVPATVIVAAWAAGAMNMWILALGHPEVTFH